MKNLNNLEGWIFTYNAINEQFLAVKREDVRDLFNDYNSKNIIKSSKIETLFDIINKYNGDTSKINLVD